MKKIISLLVTMAILMCCSATCFAAEADASTGQNQEDTRIATFTEERIGTFTSSKVTTAKVQHVSDFNGNDYAVIEFSPSGYAIVHPESGVIIEYNMNAASPYSGISGDCYYGGPTYYYHKSAEGYKHTVLEDDTLSEKDAAQLKETCSKMNAEALAMPDQIAVEYFKGSGSLESVSGSTRGTDYWVTSYSWIRKRKSGFGYKSGGYCGYIAANLLLKYYNYRGKITLTSPYNTLNSVALTNKLIEYGSGASTTGVSISTVLNSFASDFGYPQVANWAVGCYGITTEIKNNKRPCILFGDLENAGNHAALAYGYNTYENSGYSTFVCHYGWNQSGNNSYSEVHVCGLTSVYGTNTKYKIS